MSNAAAVSKRLSRSTTSNLRSYLKEERSNLIQNPLLVVSSQPGTSAPVKQVQDACDFCSFVTSMELGLPTVPISVESAFPTPRDVERGVELAKRTGAAGGAVLAVGSGAAMDLAKAISIKSNMEKLILAPATLGATLAAGASRSLVLEPKEETLLADGNGTVAGVDVVLEKERIAQDVTVLAHASYSSLAIGMDTLYSCGSHMNDSDKTNVEDSLSYGLQSLDAVNQSDHTTAHEYAILALHAAGQVLRYGIPASATSYERRSIPLALVSSILPISFPHSHVLTFTASLLPGLCQTLQTRSIDWKEGVDTELKRVVERVESLSQNCDDIPSLSQLSLDSKSAYPVSTLMKQVHANQALWDCHDAFDEVLEEVLHHSLNR